MKKAINFTEIDPKKQYILTFPGSITPQEFEEVVAELNKKGLSNFLAIHNSSGIKVDEMRKPIARPRANPTPKIPKSL